jgi:hypothetical protein
MSSRRRSRWPSASVIVREEAAVISRVDQARLDKLLAEQDLLRVDNH